MSKRKSIKHAVISEANTKSVEPVKLKKLGEADFASVLQGLVPEVAECMDLGDGAVILIRRTNLDDGLVMRTKTMAIVDGYETELAGAIKTALHGWGWERWEPILVPNTASAEATKS